MDLENKYGALEAQQRLLGLLKDFHAFCQKNEVVYSLAAGSLLGAIRHNGFIPWDDDLDVFLDRDNYKKLMRCLSHHDLFIVERDDADSLWVDRVRRKKDMDIGGYVPTVDLLVFDNVPDNVVLGKIKLFSLMCLQGMMKQKPGFNKGTLWLRICTLVTYCLGRLFPLRWKKAWYRSVSLIGDRRESKNIYFNGPFADIRKKFPSHIMDKIELHQFEDTMVCIVSEWDICLKILFGDYMTPPKESDRKPLHGGLCKND